MRDANIDSNGSSIGDVLCTARTDLGDDWALCNGEGIFGDADISLLLPHYGCKIIFPYQKSSANTIKRILQLDNKIIILGAKDNYPFIAVTTSINSTWTIKTFTDYPGYAFYDIAGNNGRYVVVGSTGTSYMILGTATDITGTWTFTTTYTTSSLESDFDLERIAFDGTTWVAVGQTHTNYRISRVFYSTDPTKAIGSWSSCYLSSLKTNRASFSDIVKFNDEWVFSGSYYDGNYYYQAIFHTSNLSEGISYNILDGADRGSVAGAMYLDQNTLIVTASGQCYVGTSIDNLASQDIGVGACQEIFKIGTSKWVYIRTSGIIYEGTSWSGPFTSRTINNGSDMTHGCVIDNSWAMGFTKNADGYGGGIVAPEIVTLPTISVNGVYNYIKVK